MLHPTVTFLAFHTHFAASAFDGLDLIRKVPKLASDYIIFILIGIAPKVLDIMSVGAFIAFMAIFRHMITFG